MGDNEERLAFFPTPPSCCYLYGGYLFLIMHNGSILYSSFERIVNQLVKKYDNPSDFLKIAFLRNEYYYGNQAKAFMKIPAMKQALMGEWGKTM